MLDVLSYTFMQHALAAALLASVACGLMGALVVVNRMVFLAGGVAHAAYGGVGLAFHLGLPVLPCAMGFTALASLAMGAVSLRARERTDTLVGVLWAGGMAAGIILIDLSPGYNVDLMSYLFGSLLAVPGADLWLMLGLDALLLALVLGFYKDLLAISYDREFARTRGVPVTFLHLLMLVMISISVVMVIRVVGLVLVIALITIPPRMAENRSRSLGWMMLGATLLSIAFCLGGLALSYVFDITSGAAIIAVATVCFSLDMGLRAAWSRLRRHGFRPGPSEASGNSDV